MRGMTPCVSYTVARYEGRALAEQCRNLTVDQAERFIRENAGNGSVLCAGFIDGRSLEDIYKEIGQTIYRQDCCIGSALFTANPEDVEEKVKRLREIENLYRLNVEYVNRPLSD